MLETFPQRFSGLFRNAIEMIKKNNILGLLNALNKEPNLVFFNSTEQPYRTLLAAAVFYRDNAITEHLIEQGAEVNAQDADLNTPLHLIASQREDNGMADLLLNAGAGIYIKNKRNETPLSIAVETNNLNLIKKMLDKNKLELVEFKDIFFLAIELRKFESAKIICEHPACFSLLTEMVKDCTPLHTIASHIKGNDIAELLLDAGADVFRENHTGETPLRIAIKSSNLHLIKKILDKRNLSLTKLKDIFFLAIRYRKFDSAKIIWEHSTGLLKFSKEVSYLYDREWDEKNGINLEEGKRKYYDEIKNSFQNAYDFPHEFEERKENLAEIYTQIYLLLLDVETCIRLFKILDDSIKEAQKELGVDFSLISPGEGIVANNLRYPSPPSEQYKSVEKKGLLRKLMRAILQEYGIETQKDLINFAGFVPEEKADQVMIDGGLFKEQFFVEGGLAHGVYGHYLQWTLIALAFKNGLLDLYDFSLKEVLASTVEVKAKTGDISVWVILLDTLTHEFFATNPFRWREFGDVDINKKTIYSIIRMSFLSTQELQSYLFFSKECPHLRGYLLDVWYKNIAKIQSLFFKKEKILIPYEIIVAGGAYAFNDFGLFDLGFKSNAVNLYLEKSKTKGTLDTTSNIITKEERKNFDESMISGLIEKFGIINKPEKAVVEPPAAFIEKTSDIMRLD